MVKKRLFQDFEPTSTSDWEAAIHKDLKGSDYNKRLVSKTISDIEIAPYYRKENLDGLEYLQSLPGQFPYTRGTNTKRKTTYIRQDINVETEILANKKAIRLIEEGVTSIGFIFNPDFKTNKATLKNLLHSINIEILN